MVLVAVHGQSRGHLASPKCWFIGNFEACVPAVDTGTQSCLRVWGFEGLYETQSLVDRVGIIAGLIRRLVL